MATDDRDQTFEKALARQLRSSASSSPDANALAGAPAAPLADLCPDPETLAAYHDGSLSSEERNLWKQHVLGCDSCQLVLAHLATPLEIPVVNVDANEKVLATHQRAAPVKAASSAPISRPSPLHSLRWLWLVPAGAIAAALIAWVSLQERKPLSIASPSPVEVAENRQPAVSAPSPKPALVAPEELKRKDQPGAHSVVGATGGALADRELTSKEAQNQVQLFQKAPSPNASPAAHGPYLSQQKQQQQINRLAAGSAGAVDQKKLDAQSSPNATGRTVGVLEEKAPASPPPPPPAALEQPSFVADGTVAAPLKDKAEPARAPTAPSNSREADSSSTTADTITSASASTALEVSAAPQSLAKTRAMMRAAALQNPHVFGAPGGKQLWRIGPAGSLEHSKDKGLNWTPQISGVYTDLIAGSAPSTKVCWIVGNSGTILRTTDGGTHWTKLDSPATADLMGVRATDATHAWIWLLTDQQTKLIKMYQTTDGGATWVSASDQ
jgi:hypothetical protein